MASETAPGNFQRNLSKPGFVSDRAALWMTNSGITAGVAKTALLDRKSKNLPIILKIQDVLKKYVLVKVGSKPIPLSTEQKVYNMTAHLFPLQQSTSTIIALQGPQRNHVHGARCPNRNDWQ